MSERKGDEKSGEGKGKIEATNTSMYLLEKMLRVASIDRIDQFMQEYDFTNVQIINVMNSIISDWTPTNAESINQIEHMLTKLSYPLSVEDEEYLRRDIRWIDQDLGRSKIARRMQKIYEELKSESKGGKKEEKKKEEKKRNKKDTIRKFINIIQTGTAEELKKELKTFDVDEEGDLLFQSLTQLSEKETDKMEIILKKINSMTPNDDNKVITHLLTKFIDRRNYKLFKLFIKDLNFIYLDSAIIKNLILSPID